MTKMIQSIVDELQRLYTMDDRPWVVGYSGGKDSTMIASLVFDAVKALSPEIRRMR